jgi:hypothetical protein
MTIFKRLISTLGLTALLALTACGGGGPVLDSNTGTGTGTGTGTVTASDLSLSLSAASIVNTGASTVTATVTALDANRNVVPGVAVTLSVNNDAVLTVQGTAGSVTSAAGTLLATVGIGSNRTNRTITVTATAGSVTKTVALQVVDASVGTTPKFIEVIAATTTVGTGGDGVLVTAFVKDDNNNALTATPVTFKADTGTLSGVSSSTNTAGAATATFASGVDRRNRTATITVTSGTIVKTLTLPITGTKLTLSGPTSLIVGGTATFDISAIDSKGAVISGAAISATSTLGNALTVSGSSETNSSGQVHYIYKATNPGTDSVTFAYTGGDASISPSPALVVSAQDFSFVLPNSAASQNQIAVGTPQEIRVLLRNASGPQVGKTISFAATGGVLSPSSFAVTSDGVNQRACDGSGAVLPAGTACVLLTSQYAGPLTVQATVAGSSTSTTLPLAVIATIPTRLTLQISPTAISPNATTAGGNQATAIAKVIDASGNPVQGQTINFTRVVDTSGGNLLQASAVTDSSGQASVAYRSGAQSTGNNGVQLRATVANFQTVTGDAYLTVNQAALFIALGTGNTITNLDNQTYKKDWVVYVTDSNGIPVNGATLAIKSIPVAYRTGALVWNGTRYEYSNPTWECRSEDANADGLLDAGEDDNNDGVLWPGNVIAVAPGSVQTVNGVATISLIYAESYAPWVRIRLTASATVAGTESKTFTEFIVGGVSTDFTVLANQPAGLVSPFGTLPKSTNGCLPVTLQ